MENEKNPQPNRRVTLADILDAAKALYGDVKFSVVLKHFGSERRVGLQVSAELRIEGEDYAKHIGSGADDVEAMADLHRNVCSMLSLKAGIAQRVLADRDKLYEVKGESGGSPTL